MKKDYRARVAIATNYESIKIAEVRDNGGMDQADESGRRGISGSTLKISKFAYELDMQ